ncbi:MAG: hypothetical protein ACREDR_13840 [Blastocatellia bacterium]
MFEYRLDVAYSSDFYRLDPNHSILVVKHGWAHYTGGSWNPIDQKDLNVNLGDVVRLRVIDVATSPITPGPIKVELDFAPNPAPFHPFHAHKLDTVKMSVSPSETSCDSVALNLASVPGWCIFDPLTVSQNPDVEGTFPFTMKIVTNNGHRYRLDHEMIVGNAATCPEANVAIRRETHGTPETHDNWRPCLRHLTHAGH